MGLPLGFLDRPTADKQSSFGLDLDATQPQGRLFTPWTRDLVVRSAVLGIRGVFGDEKVARRIAIARSCDAEFWVKNHRDDGDAETHRLRPWRGPSRIGEPQ
jgi:hypothetical protein